MAVNDLLALFPKWTEREVVEGGGRDPLGLSRVSDLFVERLLPGITTQTDRARYYSFYPWAISEIESLNEEDDDKFVEGLRRREAAFAVASLIDRRTDLTTDRNSLFQGVLIGATDRNSLFQGVLIGASVLAGLRGCRYKIQADGSLEKCCEMVNPDGGGAHIAIHPSGKFLLTAQYGGGSTALFPLDANGKLGEPTVTEHEGGSGVVDKRQDSPHPHYCGFSPDGKFALVPDLGLDQFVIYKINLEKPAITKHGVGQSIAGGGPRHMKFSPDGKFIYLLNELSLSVTTFAWDAEAGTATALTTTQAISDETKAAETFNSSAEILVSPDGKFVYSSNRGHDTVSVYKADLATGKLEVVQVQPIRGAFPRNINFDLTSTWLLAAGADSHTVAAHKIDPETGKLTYHRGAVIQVPAPICILFKK